jgi:serine/threonine protein kinase
MPVEVIDGRFVLEPDPPRIGGTAHVFKARDHDQDGAFVAVKLFDVVALTDEVLRESFLREREALEALDHPNIVRLHAAGFDVNRQQHYVALEWIDEHLLEYIARRAEDDAGDERNPGAGWDSFSQLVLEPTLAALSVAHARRILHRDIKPQNVLIDAAGIPKLADFGLAKLLDSLRVGLTVREFHSKPYAAPERFQGVVDARSDLYSLGVTALRCLVPTGFDLGSESVEAAIDAADLPEDADGFLEQLVAEDPEERFVTVASRWRSFDGCLRGGPRLLRVHRAGSRSC